MIKKIIRKLLRRAIRWALTDSEPTVLINWDISTGKNRFTAEDIVISGLRTEGGRRATINTIRTAKLNREL